jgi:hypothetical protein
MADRHENKDLKNLPACVCEFIRLVIKKMRYRRKVRQNVQDELTVHFEDELKDCPSDQQKEQKARKLIAEFGDPELLAVLLRRAKKRCRLLWRTIVARTFQTVGVLVLCLIVYTIWFMTGNPTIRVDYLSQLNQMSRPQLRDEDNAWPYYQKAINLYIEPVRDGVVEEFISFRDKPGLLEGKLRFTDLSEDEQAQILQRIQQNKKYWDNVPVEQQNVILKCFEYNWVPIFKKRHLLYRGTSFSSMTNCIIETIKERKEVTEDSIYTAVGHAEKAGFPDAELIDWIKQDKVAPNYLEAVSVAVLDEWIKRYKDLPKSTLEPLSDNEDEYISPWVKQNEPAWQEFVKGSLKSYCYREVQYNPKDKDRWVLNILAPHLSDLRNLARLGIWHSRINLKEGKTRQAIEDCLALARAGSHWQGKGSLIVEQLVGLGISRLGHEQILRLAQGQNLSAADLKELHQQLMQMYPQGYRLIDIESERLWFLDIVQHVFTDGGPGGGHLVPSRWPQFADDVALTAEKKSGIFMPLSTAASMVHARRDETVAKFNELFDKFIEIAKTSPYQRHVCNLRSDDLISALPKYRYFLIGIFIPAVDRVSEIGYRGKASYETIVTILALKRWRLEKNAYPVSLNELVAVGYLKELPMDPYSDKPLIYKRTDDDFVLYSVGPNFTDDGGVSGKDREGQPRSWRDNGDTLFWPLPKP